MKEYKRIILELPSGDFLAAEECPYDDAQIAIGIVDKEGVWVQDLAVVETNRTDEYRVYVYADETSESFTNKFTVRRHQSNAL